MVRVTDTTRERDKQFKLRLSRNEHQALLGHAEAKGLKPSDVLRQYVRSLEEFGNQKGSGVRACCHGTVGCSGRGDKHWCASTSKKAARR